VRIHRIVVPVVLALSMIATACGGADPTPPSGDDGARTVARTDLATPAARFLTHYVTSDGRVIRHDQGGDITSEGQAYGMLIAETAGRPDLVRTIWAWTAAHLGRPDGLFAWHATASGQVLDPQSATDADVLIAYALLRYAGGDATALHGSGRRVARAVLANESVTLPDGARLPVAGPWARSSSAPTVDPSYLMPGVFDGLARLTGDGRWRATAAASVAMIAGLTEGGRRLPPDWAQLTDGHLVAIAEPGGPAAVQYGPDAARIPLWFATACDANARRLAAGWWRDVLGVDDRYARTALTLNGATIDGASAPLSFVAGAAAATAAGHTGAARELQARAEAQAQRVPTYYGDAWAVLGPALLDRAINPCSDGAAG
jgi:endoglucanase